MNFIRQIKLPFTPGQSFFLLSTFEFSVACGLVDVYRRSTGTSFCHHKFKSSDGVHLFTKDPNRSETLNLEEEEIHGRKLCV